MTDDIKALVAKLREKPSYWHQPTYEFLHSDAADAIEALESENESLRIDNLGHVLGHTDAMLRTRLERAEQERDAYAAKDDERAEWVATVEATMAQVYTILKPLATTGTHAANDPVVKAYALLAAQDLEAQLAARDRRVAAEALREAADDLHHFTEVGNMFGGYDCSCGDPWYTDGCAVGNALLARADQIENGEEARRVE